MVGGQDGGRLGSVGREGLVRVEVFVVVVVDVRYSQLSESSETEGGVAQTGPEHIHGPRALQDKH